MSGSLVLRAIELPLDHLANELAMKVYTPSEIAERFSTDLDTIWELLQRPAFYKLVKQRMAIWNATSNVAARAKMLAQVTLCETLPVMYGIASDPKAASQSRVDAAKVIERAAAEAPGVNGGSASGRNGFQINIHLGAEVLSVSAPIHGNQSSLPSGTGSDVIDHDSVEEE